MHSYRLAFVLLGLLGWSVSVSQDTGDADSEFFQTLKALSHVTERPTTFQEAVERSAVIARGNLVDVIPGRAIGLADNPRAPRINTLLLKIRPTNVLKGDYDDYYLLELPGANSLAEQLNEKLFTDEVLVLLRPASDYFENPDISVWPEAQAELNSGRDLYQLTRRALLVVVAPSKNLTSPLDYHGDFAVITRSMASLSDLESYIVQGQAELRQ